MRTAITILELFNDGTVKKYSAKDYYIIYSKSFDTHSQIINLNKTILPIDSTLFLKLVDTLGFNKTVKYTPKRAKQLRDRLKSFQEADLLKAAKAIKNTPFMQGDNLQAKRYGTIDYLLRSDEIIDNYIQDGQDEIVLTEMII